jgi:predicted secreted Zn-dependent protease
MEAVGSRASSGCEDAAAFTSWTVTAPTVIYDAATGRKLATEVHVSIKTALPTWTQFHKAADEDRAEAVRFQQQTAQHERGHSLTGENVATCIANVINALPEMVPPRDVNGYHRSIQRLINEFFIPCAGMADLAYDEITNHGSVQGAESVPETGLGNDRGFDTIDGLPCAPLSKPLGLPLPH